MGAMELRGRRKSSLPDEDEDRRSSIQTKKCCVGCKTISTPMWRNGPAGPGSLCNACGIRYAKMKRSMAVRSLEKRKGRNHVSAFTRSTITPPTSSSSSLGTINTSADPLDTSNTAIGGHIGDCGGGGLGPSLKLKLIFLGKKAILQRSASTPSSSVEKEISQRRQEEEEDEQQAAFSLLELSCGSDSA